MSRAGNKRCDYYSMSRCEERKHNHRVALACGHLFDVGIKATKRVLKNWFSGCVYVKEYKRLIASGTRHWSGAFGLWPAFEA